MPTTVQTRPEPIYLDLRERRRHRRYSLPLIVVTLFGVEYPAINWSVGGFLLDGVPEAEVGTVVRGHLRVKDFDGSRFFFAKVLRRDVRAGTLAARFIAPSPGMVTILERAAKEMRRPGQEP